MLHLHVGAGGLFGLGMLAGVWMTEGPKAPSPAAVASTANAVAMMTGAPVGNVSFLSSNLVGAAPGSEAPPTDLVVDMAGHAQRLAQHMHLEQKLKLIADQCTVAYSQMPAMISGATRVPAMFKDPELLGTLQDAGLTGCAALRVPVDQLIDPTLLSAASAAPSTQ